jgi:hypothetical protein
MASWIEIDRVRKDPDAARFLAGLQLKYSYDGLSDWEIKFLGDMVARTDVEELSNRQAESLLQIRDKVTRVSKVGSFSVRLLIGRCHEGRADLNDDDAAWLEELIAEGPELIRRGQAWRLLRCARELDLIEGYVDV